MDHNTLHVRPAEVADTVVMARVMAHVAEEGSIGTEPPVDVDALAQRFRETIEGTGPSAMWALERDGVVLGHATARATGVAGVLALAMAILPEGRGAGGGRALVNTVLAHAHATGTHKLELEVWPDNARAIALYASAGFDVEGFRRDHYPRRDGSRRSALQMALLLDDPGTR